MPRFNLDWLIDTLNTPRTHIGRFARLMMADFPVAVLPTTAFADGVNYRWQLEDGPDNRSVHRLISPVRGPCDNNRRP